MELMLALALINVEERWIEDPAFEDSTLKKSTRKVS